MNDAALLRISEVCRIMAIGRSTVYSLLDRPGGLPTVKIGRARRVPAAAVREWIKHRIDTTDLDELP